MKTYIAIADEDGASVLTTIAGTTCPRCGTPVDPGTPHRCGDQVQAETQTSFEAIDTLTSAATKAGLYPD